MVLVTDRRILGLYQSNVGSLRLRTQALSIAYRRAQNILATRVLRQ